MITMMGFFAVYAGLIYNDFFSVPLDLFGSSWHFSEEPVRASSRQGGGVRVAAGLRRVDRWWCVCMTVELIAVVSGW